MGNPWPLVHAYNVYSLCQILSKAARIIFMAFGFFWGRKLPGRGISPADKVSPLYHVAVIGRFLFGFSVRVSPGPGPGRGLGSVPGQYESARSANFA